MEAKKSREQRRNLKQIYTESGHLSLGNSFEHLCHDDEADGPE